MLKHEGGYVNHPDDPGGATNMGVTQASYNAWRRRQKRAVRSVRHIDAAELRAIYRHEYWDKVRGDDLPEGVDYAVFDFAVNSGPRRAARFLQRVVCVEDDGAVGPLTLTAVAGRRPEDVVADLCAARLAWLKRLKHWPTFGRGWSRRVVEVQRNALEMAAGGRVADSSVPAPSPQGSDPHPARAPDPEPEPDPERALRLWLSVIAAVLVAAFFLLA